MKFQRQLIMVHNPAEGRYGDCYRTCIAILLGLDAVEVPHFVEYSILDAKSTREDTNTTAKLAREWLAQRGQTLLCVNFGADTPGWCVEEWTAGLPFILSVNGSHPNTSHAVIGQMVDGALRCIWCPTVGGPRTDCKPWRCLETGNEFFSAELIVGIPESLL